MEKRGSRKERKKLIIITILLIFAGVMFGFAEWILLPGESIVQTGAFGNNEIRMPKTAVVTISLVISFIFAVIYFISKGLKKYLILTCLSYVFPIINIILNI